jgi:WhiB family redox-sensing transcriptional regulator
VPLPVHSTGSPHHELGFLSLRRVNARSPGVEILRRGVHPNRARTGGTGGTGGVRRGRAPAHKRKFLAFPLRIVNDDISVVTSVLCDFARSRVDDREGDRSMDMVSLMYGPQERSWQTKANCMGVDPDLFFPERGASTREAKEVCRGCVVREDCLEYALANGEKFGIWGGLSERERRRLRRQRAMQRRAIVSAS